MPSVLTWIVAVEQYTPPDGAAKSDLDFPTPVSRRALEWAEWLTTQSDIRLLLNIAVPAGSAERTRLEKLTPLAVNAAEAHLATAAALRSALRVVTTPPIADVLLLLWIGHGVMNERRRFLLVQDASDPTTLHSWDVHSLLQRLRSGDGPALQIGAFDACAQRLETPPHEDLGGDGSAQRRQHYYFAATAAAVAAPTVLEDSVASILLDGLKAGPWPPEPAPLHVLVQGRMDKLASGPIRWEFTTGSGDLWSAPGSSAEVDARIKQAARAADMHETLFRHLFKELDGTGRTPAELAQAVLADTVTAFAGGGLAATLLPAALQRVRRVAPWVTPLTRLHLGLPHWNELASRVAADDGRTTPRFAELIEVLLWAIDMGVTTDQRGERAFLKLLLLAGKEATRSVPGSAAATKALEDLIEADAAFAPLLADAKAAATLSERPLVLLVELLLPQGGGAPVLGKAWLLQDVTLEPAPEIELDGPPGLQLITLIEHVRTRTQRPLRVQLLAPTELLCGSREWVSYCFDETDDAADAVDIDTLVPMSWRWRDRLLKKADPRFAHGNWRARAQQAQLQARQRASLICRFDDEPPAPGGAAADLLALSARPPGPSDRGPRRATFMKTLVQGHPYMVWPAGDTADVAQLKAAVVAWLNQQQFLDLPEGYAACRGAGGLPNLVLFLDEPEHNPYEQVGQLRSMAAIP